MNKNLCLIVILVFGNFYGGSPSEDCPILASENGNYDLQMHDDRSQPKDTPRPYRFKMGSFEVTVLCDGYLDLYPKNLKPADSDLSDRLYDDSHTIKIPINIYLINTGSKVILVDAGLNTLYDTGTGLLWDHMESAGYSPNDIDAVLLTHLHPDHIAGLLTKEGNRAFPNAIVYAAQEEVDFWTCELEESQAPEDNRPVFSLARKILAPYRREGKLRSFARNQVLFPGVIARAATGHTPGHTGFLFESHGEELFLAGDIVHAHDVQFAHPNVGVEFDLDMHQAIETRKKIFAEAAAHHMLVGGAHLPYPGLGFIHTATDGKYNESYVWKPLN